MGNKGIRFGSDAWNRLSLEEGEEDYAAQLAHGPPGDPHALCYRLNGTVDYTTTALEWLERYDVKPCGEGYYSVPPAARAVLVAEAVNLAAKCIDPEFYTLKPAIFVEAARRGKDDGVTVYYREEDGTWNLYHPAAGVVSFHDPGDEIPRLIGDAQAVTFSPQPYPWSGVFRQDSAFDILHSADTLARFAATTQPDYSCTPADSLGTVKEVHGNRLTQPYENAGRY